VFGYLCDEPQHPYDWRTLNTVDRFWRTHMDLVENRGPALHSESWPVFTRHQPLKPARVLADAYVDAAVLSPGCVVAGDVTRSVVSTKCLVGPNAVIRDSVLLPGAVVGAGCILDRVIVDCDARIPQDTMLGARLGSGFDYYASPEGVVLATAARPSLPYDVATRAIA
jgi:glucose-1-phosphate adenylyltransferase